jgi:hypothetical protein
MEILMLPRGWAAHRRAPTAGRRPTGRSAVRLPKRDASIPHLEVNPRCASPLSVVPLSPCYLLTLCYSPGLACRGPRMPSAMASLPTNPAGRSRRAPCGWTDRPIFLALGGLRNRRFPRCPCCSAQVVFFFVRGEALTNF